MLKRGSRYVPDLHLLFPLIEADTVTDYGRQLVESTHVTGYGLYASTLFCRIRNPIPPNREVCFCSHFSQVRTRALPHEERSRN